MFRNQLHIRSVIRCNLIYRSLSLESRMPPNSKEVCGGASYSGRPDLDAKLAEWLEWTPPGSPDHAAVKALVEAGEFDRLEKMMMSRKNFGTAGIRAKMGPG